MMKRQRQQREEKLIDIGSTTAISSLVEIIAEKQSNADATGILARQAKAMLSRLDLSDHGAALEGFCDELQSFVESVPGARSPARPYQPERTARRTGSR